ncbi:MAG: nicotinate-nucleotide--dimethylbenzimidazole phosphoribosyltransferase [Micromonosporaceae bacterium]|nr:nicotinate-nucleotide--dimethylbenzimidazole phosphoribosyltransferase [Micromonosporaceae bacterium]
MAPRSAAAEAAARARLDALVKPRGALGRLEELAAWLAGAQDRCPPAPLDRVRVVVLAGDHGVSREGVSAYPREVTAAMIGAFLAGLAGVCVAARQHGIPVRVLDIGVDADLPAAPAEVTAYKVRRGSGVISREDALAPGEAARAWVAGAAIAEEEITAGADLLIAGDMGIGNTTVAAALVAATLDLPAAAVAGTGTGIDAAVLAHKTAVIGAALARPRAPGPVGSLTTLGSADAAATVGFLLRAAARGVPVLLDGVFSSACALVAGRAVPAAVDWWLAGHRSTEPSQRYALDALGLRPILDVGMRLGEGSGAVTAVPVLRTAQALIAGMGTLSELGAGPGPAGAGR